MTTTTGWTDCPRCMDKTAREIEQIRAQNKATLDDAYGVLSQDEYNNIVLHLPRKEYALLETLAETLVARMGIEGQVEIHYACACSVPGCGFKHKFRHKENVEL